MRMEPRLLCTPLPQNPDWEKGSSATLLTFLSNPPTPSTFSSISTYFHIDTPIFQPSWIALHGFKEPT